MNQIAFSIGGKEIHWYGVCIAIGFIAASMILQYKRKHAGLESGQGYDISMLALFGCLTGARIFYVIEFWQPVFAAKPWTEIFRIDHGGLVFYGGFILGLISVIIYAKIKKINFLALLDILGPAIAAAHACGRIGCFLQGCCFGIPAPKWFPCPVRFPAGSDPAFKYPSMDSALSMPLYPVQLMEAGMNIILCIVLLCLFRIFRKKGEIAGIYIMGYAVIRFLLEFCRGDHIDSFLGLTPSQSIAILLFPCGLALFLYAKQHTSDEVTHA